MKQIFISALMMGFAFTVNAQVIVNDIDVNTSATTMEVWAFKKPFSSQESYFMNYGQDKFRPHYYDHKTQVISDKDGNKFKKGEWLKLVNYLEKEGWEQKNERSENIGDAQGRIVTFSRKE